jgi:hypothetical protein
MTAMISDSSPEAGGRTKPRERPAGREVLHGRAAEQSHGWGRAGWTWR